MFASRTILIADASTYAALDLCAAIEGCDGCVAGPVTTLSEAMAIVDEAEVGGAIVDCELPGASALVMRLAEKGVPLVVQTSIPLPDELAPMDGRLPVLMRPVDPHTVIDALAGEIGKARIENQNRLGSQPKQV